MLALLAPALTMRCTPEDEADVPRAPGMVTFCSWADETRPSGPPAASSRGVARGLCMRAEDEARVRAEVDLAVGWPEAAARLNWRCEPSRGRGEVAVWLGDARGAADAAALADQGAAPTVGPVGSVVFVVALPIKVFEDRTADSVPLILKLACEGRSPQLSMRTTPCGGPCAGPRPGRAASVLGAELGDRFSDGARAAATTVDGAMIAVVQGATLAGSSCES